MAYKIVADSSCDFFTMEGVDFASAALTIITDERQFRDDPNLNLDEMLDYLSSYKGRSGTSCPTVGDWLAAFGDAEGVFAITITSSLSGSYGAAMQAKEVYESSNPGRKVCCLDSLSTGPELTLIAEKLRALIHEGLDFDEIEARIREYMTHTHLIFILKSLNNMARNGRVSPIVASAVGLLGIRILGIASAEGTLQSLRKCRGEQSALQALMEDIRKRGFKGGSVRIAHCRNSKGAVAVADLIRKDHPFCDIRVTAMAGLDSFYAEPGSIMVGYSDL